MKQTLIITGIICIFAYSLMSRTIHVPSEEPTIQAGIDASVDGDTVFVAPGKGAKPAIISEVCW